MITPYHPEAFQFYLKNLGLLDVFPNLVHDLTYGFKIGVPDSLLADTIIPPYHASDYDTRIDRHFEEERAVGRMSGPFSLEEMKGFFGKFAACPVHVVETVDEDGNPKFRVVRNFSWVGGEVDYSVNDLIDSEDFPTEWGTASRIAELVSPVFLSICRFNTGWFFHYPRI